jgi:hypothetical protein
MFLNIGPTTLAGAAEGKLCGVEEAPGGASVFAVR